MRQLKRQLLSNEAIGRLFLMFALRLLVDLRLNQSNYELLSMLILWGGGANLSSIIYPCRYTFLYHLDKLSSFMRGTFK